MDLEKRGQLLHAILEKAKTDSTFKDQLINDPLDTLKKADLFDEISNISASDDGCSLTCTGTCGVGSTCVGVTCVWTE